MTRNAWAALIAVALVLAGIGVAILAVDQAPIRRGPIPLPSPISQRLATASPTP